MPGPNRGALPLALLIVAALAAGIVVAVMRLDEQEKEKAGPEPTVESPEPTLPSPTFETPTSTPETPESPEPTQESPTPEPTDESPSPEPTEESPSPEPTDGGGGGGGNNGDNHDVLAQTGGPILPYLIGGVLMLAGSAGLWRLRRLFD